MDSVSRDGSPHPTLSRHGEGGGGALVNQNCAQPGTRGYGIASRMFCSPQM